jgi:hypothetical protein
MDTEERLPVPDGVSPFERIGRINAAGAEYRSRRDFAQVLGYSDYRNFGQISKRAKNACFNSGHRIEDHFVEIAERIKKLGTRRHKQPETWSLPGARWAEQIPRRRKTECELCRCEHQII